MNSQSLPVFRWFLTFASMFTAGAVGFMLPSAGAHPTLPLLTGGIAVAACIRWGRQMWPAVLAAGMGIDLWMHQAPGASLFVGLGAAGGALCTAWILEATRLRQEFRPSPGRPAVHSRRRHRHDDRPNLGIARIPDRRRHVRPSIRSAGCAGGATPPRAFCSSARFWWPSAARALRRSPNIGRREACGCWRWRFVVQAPSG